MMPKSHTTGRGCPISLPPRAGRNSNASRRRFISRRAAKGSRARPPWPEVILNRVESPTFPQTICGVVNQGNSRGCQFSFTCDGRPENIRDRGVWTVAGKIARAMIDGAPRKLTDGATYFHTPAVKPSWAKRFEKTTKIGRHIFYRAPMQTAMH